MVLKGIGEGMTITEAEAESDGQNTSIGVVKFHFGTVHRFIDQILLEGYACFLMEKSGQVFGVITEMFCQISHRKMVCLIPFDIILYILQQIIPEGMAWQQIFLQLIIYLQQNIHGIHIVSLCIPVRKIHVIELGKSCCNTVH